MKTAQIDNSEDHITSSAVEQSPAKLISAGSVLIVTRSGILSHTLPVGVTTVPVTVNQDLKALTPRPGVLPEYVAWALRCFARDILKACSKQGTTVNSIETAALHRFEIPLAPLDEQRRIVAEIEKQFSRLDEGVTNLNRVKANVKRYKAAVLKAAVEGRLVETEDELARREGQIYETGEELLARVTKASIRATGGTKRTKPPPHGTDKRAPSPKGWCWTTPIEACDVVVDCHNKTAPYADRGTILVRTSNIRDGQLMLEDVRFVDDATYQFWSKRCPPEPGDVLFTREAPMGEAAVIPEGTKLCMGQRMMLLRPGAAVRPEFLVYAITSPTVRRFIERTAVGSGVKHLRVSDVEHIPLPLPPMGEQVRIISEVDQRLSLLGKLEDQVDTAFRRAARLRAAVLRSTFTSPFARMAS